MRRKIGIDFHVADGKYQGSRSHVIELFAQVIDLSPDLEFFLFLDDTDSLRNLSVSFRRENVHLVRMPSANPMTRLLWQLPVLAKQHALDILHCQYIIPPVLSCAGMVTIHDVLFETHPEYFEPFFRLRSRVLMRHSARRAAHVFTVSDYSKSEMASRFDLNESCISVIHNAADPQRFFPGNEGIEIIGQRGLQTGEYLLTVGRIEPRKNHDRLLKAYSALGANVPPLVIVGQSDSRRVDIHNMIGELGLSGRVVLIGNANDAELPALLRHASMFIYPAIAEGFGMPPLEAMASGVPVVASNLTSLPEVVGDAGVLVDPLDTDALAKAIFVTLNDVPLRSRLRQAGPERAQKFSWLESAKLVRECYLACLKAQK